MRHGSLLATGLTLALAGFAAAQPDRTPASPAAADKSTPATAPVDTPKTIPPSATVPPATLGTVLPPGGANCGTPIGIASPELTGVTDGGHQYWFSVEYLWWRIKDQSVPPLVATGPAQFPVGFLGSPGTVVLLGGGDLDQGTLNGVRLRAGGWLDACRTIGLEGSFFCLLEDSTTTSFSSNQFPVLTRPFTDINTGSPNSEFIAFPGISTGGVSVESTTKLCGAAILARCPICCNCDTRLDAIGGLTYLDLREELTIVETPLFSPTAPFPGLAGNQFIATDKFKTRNQFVGATIGAEGSYFTGPWMVTLAGSVAVGVNRQTIEIEGSQVIRTPAGTTTTVPGGLLALPGANIGKFTNNEFSVAPQVGINIGYQITENIQIFAGYTCLYWTNVVRPGSQIDPVLDVNRIPNFGTASAARTVRPVVPFHQTDFWAQGVSIGVAFSW